MPADDLDALFALDQSLAPSLSLDLDVEGETAPLDLTVQVTVRGRVVAEGHLQVPASAADVHVPVQLNLRRG